MFVPTMVPRVSRRGKMLLAKTGWLPFLLSLFTFSRQVEVDPQRREVRIYKTFLLVFRTCRVIPFREIEFVGNNYHQLGNIFAFATDTVDVHTVYIQKKASLKKIPVFRFIGEGQFVNNSLFPDWMYAPDRFFDYVGNQGIKSHEFTSTLRSAIGCATG